MTTGGFGVVLSEFGVAISGVPFAVSTVQNPQSAIVSGRKSDGSAG